ncbi:MAG TPA: hypothetical protein VFT79_09225 [Solirubrobacterales bacterium]|nr:hypothetical protein [Solirubrobacterales bacterium]
MTATAHKWICSGCGVSATRSDAEAAPIPESWDSCSEGDFCLGCRRRRVGEAAVESAPEDCNRDKRAKLRRAALLEFEVRRDPDRTNGSIAKACRSSIAAVAAARQKLDAPAPPPTPSRYQPRSAAQR